MKKLLPLFAFSILFILFSSVPLLSQNELTVKVPDYYYSKPGYIDQAVLVVEPHGGYSEESLYLNYSDHGGFYGFNAAEIIHRFELPQGSVVNDMWLWIGDSVMKAICLDTWTARSIYDSIVSMKRDPAFLTKNGNKYELHVYPLTPGSFRRIKLNFITPTRWIGDKAMVELPLAMLKSNNNTVKPISILFRSRQNQWGEPSLVEAPETGIGRQSDTLDYSYKELCLDDISKYNSLKLSFNAKLQEGMYYDSNVGKDSTVYFQASFLLKDALKLQVDSAAKKNLVAIDLSGRSNKNFSTVIPDIKKYVKASLKANDQFNIMISGAGRTKKLSPVWHSAVPSAVDTLLDSFLLSGFADSISFTQRPDLIFCDNNASKCWSYTGLDQQADIQNFYTLKDAAGYLKGAEIAASYNQGYEAIPSSIELPAIISALDTFFIEGGRFLTYFDLNRVRFQEPVATHYIKGLGVGSVKHYSVTLYRNAAGNIGLDFPESVEHSGTYFLTYTDPDVKVELMDKDGHPAVISKRIDRGIIVVSGMWSFNDDAPLKKMLNTPLLGINRWSDEPSMLTTTLEKLKDEYSKDKFDKALLISNSDSLVLQSHAEAWAKGYSASFSDGRPVINSVNLLNNQEVLPASLTVGGTTYLGSGYLMKSVADELKGIHIESYLNDRDVTASLLSPYSLPKLEELRLSVSADGQEQNVTELREIKQVPQDNNPRFFIGSAKRSAQLKFSLSAKLTGSDSLRKAEYTMPVYNDTVHISEVIPSMLGNEKIKDLYAASPLDTAQIVRLGVKYNLLCDFTALIALEPNDTLHFMKDPLDETIFTGVDEEKLESDSLGLSVYPNPFNSMTRIKVSIRNASAVYIRIYNILGQLVNTIAENEEISASKIYTWDGRNNFGQTVSSGIYFTRVEISDKYTGKKSLFSRKLMLVK